MRIRILVIIISIIVFLFNSSNFSLGAEEEKIGYIDLSRLFDEYNKTKDLDKELEKKSDAKQAEREKIVKEIKAFKDELELANEKARDKKQEQIDKKIKELQDFDETTRDELTKERDVMVRDILAEIDKIIQEYGENKKYTYIFNDRILLYGKKEFNITDDILNILNEKYLKK